jgi:hypothetical protein
MTRPHGEWQVRLALCETPARRPAQARDILTSSLLSGHSQMRSKLRYLIVMLIALLVIAALIDYNLSGPHNKLLASASRKDTRGDRYWVTVHQNASRFRINLFEEGFRSKLLVSSYEFYEGSLPMTNAVINWPDLNSFAVSFTSAKVLCSWSRTEVNWKGPSR